MWLERVVKGMSDLARVNSKPPVDQLTPVEAKVWEMFEAGKTVDEIAQALSMKVVSVRRRMPVIKEKLACQ
jgi:DNA-binding NarL/FixJ family response regulator